MFFLLHTTSTAVLFVLSVGWSDRLPRQVAYSTPVQLDKSYGRHSKHNHCHYMLKHLQDGNQVSVHMPPEIEGHWVSESCEVRPGPEFLTRYYSFFSNHTFQALQFYYRDNHCTKPSYTLLIEGSLQLRQASWFVRGGTEADYQLSLMLLVSHSTAAAKELQVKLEKTCGLTEHLKPGLSNKVWDKSSDLDCSHVLDFSMQELQLVRLERHLQPNEPGRPVEQLFVGDVHTERAQRRIYNPSGYQPPLQNIKTFDQSCAVCQIISEADFYHPPILPSHNDHPMHLYGNWVSKRCEVRPGVLFLTRHFIFHKNSNDWEGHYSHYSDPLCRRPTFSISAKGHYSTGVPSATVMGGTEYTFTVTQMKVTPMDVATTSLLNIFSGDECGKQSSWRLGVQQDVTSTSGCAALGIRLPHTEYELFYMGKDSAGHRLLFNGRRPTNGSSPDRPHKRATSYQPPLIYCSSGHKGAIGIGRNGEHHFIHGHGWNTQHHHLLYTTLLVSFIFSAM